MDTPAVGDLSTAKYSAYVAAGTSVIATAVLVADIASRTSEEPPANGACGWRNFLNVTDANIPCLQEHLNAARNANGFDVSFMLIEGLSSFLFIIPLLAAMPMLGKATATRFLAVVPFCTAVGIRFLELCTRAGTIQVVDWMAGPDWALGPHGLQMLVIATWVSRASFVWLVAMDGLLIGTSLVAIATLVYKEELFNRKFGHLSMATGVLMLLGFILDIARFGSWRVLSMSAQLIYTLCGFILLPIWVVWLGNSLGRYSSLSDPIVSATDRRGDGL